MVGQRGQEREEAQVLTLHVPLTSLMVLGLGWPRLRERQDASSANIKIKHSFKQLNTNPLTINGTVLQV